jgi:hypothetical protein
MLTYDTHGSMVTQYHVYVRAGLQRYSCEGYHNTYVTKHIMRMQTQYCVYGRLTRGLLGDALKAIMRLLTEKVSAYLD